MKTPHTIIVSRLAIGLMIALGSVFAAGCAKDVKNDTVVPGEGTRVVVSISGIDEGKSSSLLKLQGAAGAVSAANSGTGLVEGEGFEMFVSHPQSGASNLGAKGKIRAAASSSDGLRAAVPMTKGFAYRVFLRKQGSSTLESAPFIAGTAGSIAVDKGATYEWFAVSYNSVTAVPEPSGNDVELAGVTNLLYAKGEFTVENSEGDVVVPLAIVFKPRVTKVVVEVNTMGMFAPIVSGYVIISGLYGIPDAMDVVSGDLLGFIEGKVIDFSDFQEVPGSDGQRIVATTYLAGNADELISMDATMLEIALDDGTTRSFGGTTMSQKFLPEAGTEQRIVLNFIESPLTQNGVQWSRSNLYYRTDVLPSNPYRFNHVNEYNATVDPNSYFAFRGHLPRKFASADESKQKDPCALVYPAGLWKTPNHMETSVVISRSGPLQYILANMDTPTNSGSTSTAESGPNYIQFTPQKGLNELYGDATSGNNKLRFNYNGLQTNIGATDGIIPLNLGSSKGAFSAFWTNQKYNNSFGVPGLSYINFIGYIGKNLAGGDIVAATIAASPWPVDDLGLNVLVSELMNVRCIRDTGWEAASKLATYNPYPDLSDL